MVDPASERLPVQIITGFLGSGKTTLLNHLLKQPVGQATAVIINEFGEIGIDHLLVETSTEEMIELNNGCICCTIRGDLADKLGSLAMWLDSGKARLAIVASDDLNFGVARMHEVLGASPNLEIAVFRDLSAAEEWALGGGSSSGEESAT